MTDPKTHARETDNPSGDPTPPADPPVEPTDPPADPAEPQEPAEGGEGGRSSDPVEDLQTDADRVAEAVSTSAESFTTSQLDQIAGVARTLESALATAKYENSPSNQVARSYETRNQAIAEALGTDLTVEAIRSLKRDAEMGGELFHELVRDAVAARVAALGENANAEEYRKQLEASRSVGFVKSEITAYTAIKASKFTPGRTVVTRAVEPREAPKQAADKPTNILSRS